MIYIYICILRGACPKVIFSMYCLDVRLWKCHRKEGPHGGIPWYSSAQSARVILGRPSVTLKGPVLGVQALLSKAVFKAPSVTFKVLVQGIRVLLSNIVFKARKCYSQIPRVSYSQITRVTSR